jgi:uncharacterized protein YbbC (DUF1343 family)
MMVRMRARRYISAIGCALVAAGCTAHRGPTAATAGPPSDEHNGVVRPGITVLLEDSMYLVRGRRVGLITNQTGVNERGISDIDVLMSDPRAKNAGIRLTTLFSPEHGIRGTEDHELVANERDTKSGLPVISLYTVTTIAPPDSTLADLDVLLVDLQDIGARTWTYEGITLYAMRAAKRRGMPILVLDRPNPITGVRTDPPVLDSALANPEEHSAQRPGRAYALYPLPLRHGMTMGELARFYNETLKIGADLHVIPARGWRRSMWFDETGLPWIRPSPNMPSLTSALLYPAIVPFEGAPNVSVGRGTDAPFQRIGASWLRAKDVVKLLEERDLPGLHYEAERFTPRDPGDGKYAGREIPGIRIVVTDRDRVNTARLSAVLLWALAKTSRDSLRIDATRFDERLGAARVREALLRGDDPDDVVDRELPRSVEFTRRARQFYLYR